MVKRKIYKFIITKHLISLKIKKYYKFSILKSIIHNFNLHNLQRATWHIKMMLAKPTKTGINDSCLLTGVLKKSKKKINFNRFELHKLCRQNKLNMYQVNSW